MNHQSIYPLESNLWTTESHEEVSRSEESLPNSQKMHMLEVPEITRIMLESIILKNARTMNPQEQHHFLRIMHELLDLTANIR